MSDSPDTPARQPRASAPTVFGANMFGGARQSRQLNTYALWQYLLIGLVTLFACLYAAPNLFPPDYAVQVVLDAADGQLDPAVLKRTQAALDAAKVPHFGGVVEDRRLTLRVPDNDAQLRAKAVIEAELNADGGSDFVVALNLAPTTPAWLAGLGGEPMKYGLDLSGGVHLALQVDMDKPIRKLLEGTERELQVAMREANIRFVGRTHIVGDALLFPFVDAGHRERARSLIVERNVGQFDVTDDVASEGARPALRLTLSEAAIAERRKEALTKNVESLRNRVNELGVSEPLVQAVGGNRIVVDLPGIQDSATARRILGKVANLDFRLVAKVDTPAVVTERYPYEGREVIIERDSITSGDHVTNAVQDTDPETSMPQVSITLDGDGGAAMNRATAVNVGHPMAILFVETRSKVVRTEVDGKTVDKVEYEELPRLISVATIQSALGNRFRITGLSLMEARELALLLRAGALAAPMAVVEERLIGASLGAGNVERGFTSTVVGFIMVLVFVQFYYRTFGTFANTALTLNLVLLIAVMSLLGATLTLPGIAGIVLTVGMAVDANVLINSRIREEVAAGTPPQQAISAGYDRAYLTIVDSNLTTLIVGIILYFIGTGPIRGFAITLSIGIATSMFTSVMCTRALVNLWYGGRSVDRLSIG